MSKDRARRRAEREKEAAIRAAARAAEAERRERREARRRALRDATTGRLPSLATSGRPTGLLARRRRIRVSLLNALLGLVVVVVWAVRPDWPARLGVVVVAALAYPVLYTLLVRRR